MLTNTPVESRAAPAQSVLTGSGLVDGYLTYSVGLRSVGDLRRLGHRIGEFEPDLLIYLVSRTSAAAVLRDYCFHRLWGVRRSVGFPFAKSLRRVAPPKAADGLWEFEASLLARRLAPLGDAGIDRPENWSLGLSEAEIAEAGHLLAEAPAAAGKWLGLSIGTKQAVKDWGGENWRRVLHGLRDLDCGLVLIGAEDEKERSDEVARDWPGPVLNFCGRTNPRISAAIMARLTFLLCHDSGPMHLAAAVGTRCVAVFGKTRPPGQWFPCGTGHEVLYPPPHAVSLEAISPEAVIAAARRLSSSLSLSAGHAR